MPSDLGIRGVCEDYGVTLGGGLRGGLTRKYIWSNKFNRYRFIPNPDWEALTDKKLEELVASWLLELCFGDDSAHQLTNICSEILIPNGPKTCTL